MKVLVACEESQVVCSSFRLRGFDAFSCDLKPCSGFPGIASAIAEQWGDFILDSNYT